MNTVQPQPLTQSLQPVAAATPLAGGESRVGTVARSRFHWSHAILAIGVLAVSGAGTVVVFKVSFVLLAILSRTNHFMTMLVVSVV